MVSSWLSSSDIKKSQNTSGVEPIKSLLRSLNLNRARLPGTLTFRDNSPGPDKSLCQIVSRISNCVDIDSKSVKARAIEFIQHNTINNDSQESCALNSRTESEIQSLTVGKNYNLNDNITGELFKQNCKITANNYNHSLNDFAKLNDTYSGNCGTIYKHDNINAESLRTIKRWGSAKSFTPNIGDINNDTCYSTGSNTCKKKVASTIWPNNFVNSERVFNSLNHQLNIPINTQLSTISHSHPGQSQQRHTQSFNIHQSTLSQKSANSHKEKQQLASHPRVDTVKKAKNLLVTKASHDKLSIDIDKVVDEKILKEANSENPYHHTHLSINNYINSPNDSPLIPSKPPKLYEEVTTNGHEKKSSKRNITKIIAKRKLIDNTINERQEIKRIPPVDYRKNNDTKFKCNSSSIEGELCKQLSDNYHLNNSYCPSIDYQEKKHVKMQNRRRLDAVLSGDRRTVAKPSQVLIPQSVRARHIFEPFANVHEQPEIKLHMMNVKKKNGHSDNDHYKSVICKNSCDSNAIWEKSDCIKSLPSNRDATIFQCDQNPKRIINNNTNINIKHNKHIVESNLPVLTSKTFMEVTKNSDVTQINFQHLSNINNELTHMTEDKRSNNRHLKSLQMLKELLSRADDDYITEESIEYSDDAITIDKSLHSIKKLVNDNSSQRNDKCEMFQSLQVVSDIVEHLDAFTETHQTFVDAKVSCSIPTIVSYNNESLNVQSAKCYRMISTQTSITSFQSSEKLKKDTCVETIRHQLHSKYVNTERCILIDSATGKDVLEIQNFCCDTQLINTTESSIFDNNSVDDLTVRVNSVESEISSFDNVINIEINNNSSIDNCNRVISSISNQLISSNSSLFNNERYDMINGFPNGVIRAFEIASNRANNLHRAIEIYRQHEIKMQYELKSISVEYKNDRQLINLLRDDELKSQSLITALDEINKSENITQDNLTELILRQQVQYTLDKVLEHVVNDIKHDKSVKIKNFTSKMMIGQCDDGIDLKWICSTKILSYKTLKSTSRLKILSIIYGVVCTLVFCSLQFSTSCEFQ